MLQTMTTIDEIIVGGVLGSSKNPDEASFVVSHGKGAKLWSSSGHEYTDYVLGSGPMVLGHAHPAVVDAITAQAARGTQFYLMNEVAPELARRVCRLVPCAETVKFVGDGAEATFYSLRLARAFTGRSKILKFAGGYHGHHDYVQQGVFDASGRSGLSLGPDNAGIPQAISEDVLLSPFNDLEAARRLVAEYGPDLAAIIVEPIQRALLPEGGFLQGLRDLCDQNGSILVFDEIVTGFRVAPGGAQELYGVTPDLCALGKILGGGLPIAAVAGRRDLIELSVPYRAADGRSIFLSGTLNGNPLCAAAGIATLDTLQQIGAQEKIAKTGEALRRGLEENARKLSIPFQMVGHPTFAQPVFREGRIRNYADFAAADFQLARRFGVEMIKRGQNLVVGGKVYISTEHDENIVSSTVEAGFQAMSAMRDAGHFG
ncbi:aspartate aminotransferase family protein [Arvimicrobium flavum]|uniref:aspartate aminotransferase family protein n=1 Tax=Arvimicrobium flavum TaxID=3393320 RepID=UPI00237A551E|nr:aminotransferase class III-fold pyridoxal phosphate-dependent enzyme [Mesorhizobium shangrilense]